MYCTTLYLEKRILYRCLFLILSIGLLLQSLTPLQSQECGMRHCFPRREADAGFAG